VHEIENEVDRIIVEPKTVPVYRIGELKIGEMRAYAQKELGPSSMYAPYTATS
jgi:uncharacterized protein (DUF885 family)